MLYDDDGSCRWLINRAVYDKFNLLLVIYISTFTDYHAKTVSDTVTLYCNLSIFTDWNIGILQYIKFRVTLLRFCPFLCFINYYISRYVHIYNV